MCRKITLRISSQQTGWQRTCQWFAAIWIMNLNPYVWFNASVILSKFRWLCFFCLRDQMVQLTISMFTFLFYHFSLMLMRKIHLFFKRFLYFAMSNFRMAFINIIVHILTFSKCFHIFDYWHSFHVLFCCFLLIWKLTFRDNRIAVKLLFILLLFNKVRA